MEIVGALVLLSCISLAFASAGALSSPSISNGNALLRQGASLDGSVEKKPRVVKKGGEETVYIPVLEKAVDPDNYILGPYDQVIVILMGPESRSFSLTVLPEGDVMVPGVGAVHADGLALTDFRNSLSEKVGEYFKNIKLYCYLEVPRRFRVFLTGEIKRPGPVSVTGLDRVSDAIEMAGGVGEIGSERLIRLDRDGEKQKVDLLKFLAEGNFSNNPFLRGGDRIHVPFVESRALIVGQVKKPGRYEIVPGEKVRDIIHLAGGFTSEAVVDSVLLSRIGPGGGAATISVPSSRFDLPLRDLDEISIYDNFKGRRRVFAQGAVRRTGRFFLGPGESIADLLVKAGGFEENADLDSAYLERRGERLVRINLRDYVSPHPVNDLPLEDGDVLTVPPIHPNVTVGGEVNSPGEFQYRSDLTVIYYIGLAGGPNEEGDVNRVVIFSPDGSSRRAKGDSYPSRGDVIIVKRSKLKIFGEFFGGLIRLGTVVISIIVLTK